MTKNSHRYMVQKLLYTEVVSNIWIMSMKGTDTDGHVNALHSPNIAYLLYPQSAFTFDHTSHTFIHRWGSCYPVAVIEIPPCDNNFIVSSTLCLDTAACWCVCMCAAMWAKLSHNAWCQSQQKQRQRREYFIYMKPEITTCCIFSFCNFRLSFCT